MSKSGGRQARSRVDEAARSVLRNLQAARRLPFGGGWLTESGLKQLVYPHWAVPEALRLLKSEGKLEDREVKGDVHWRTKQEPSP